jgi:EAL domain-containing protein (putative c-di-GMP-specific phosphodiesterase class I)
MTTSFQDDPRGWSGPLDNLSDSERGMLEDSMRGDRTHVDVDQALREHWLEIWYQPKIDLRRKCLAGAEALARIHHPTLGILLPHSFLPGIDDDCLARLTEHALLTTLYDWTTFDEAGYNLHLAINVPVGSLLRLPVPSLVREYRPKSDRWPGLVVEVSEDQIVRDIALASEIAKQLKVSGVSVAIDDFGGGYSSFASLRELPFAELKIDHTFVKNCASEGTNGAICQTAIDLAHRFGSVAVAEGIEQMADLQALQVMRCDYGQGVLLSPPMPKERFIGLLNSRNNKRPQPAVQEVAAVPSAVGRVA